MEGRFESQVRFLGVDCACRSGRVHVGGLICKIWERNRSVVGPLQNSLLHDYMACEMRRFRARSAS